MLDHQQSQTLTFSYGSTEVRNLLEQECNQLLEVIFTIHNSQPIDSLNTSDGPGRQASRQPCRQASCLVSRQAVRQVVRKSVR